MKNKLLLSSALASGLIAGNVASAQTTITGQLDLAYNMYGVSTTAKTSRGQATGVGSAADGFGRESQINVQNKGKLSNGIDYAAGFALEYDGNSESASITNENFYIDLLFNGGKTILSLGGDHLPNMSHSAVPRTGSDLDTLLGSQGMTNAYDFNSGVGFGSAGVVSLGVSHDFGPLKVIGLWTNNYMGYEAGGGAESGIAGGDGDAAYEIMARGDLGVKGLYVNLARSKANKNQGAAAVTTYSTGATLARDWVATQAGLSYTFGDFAAGYQRSKIEEGHTASNTQGRDLTSHEYGITYAVNKDLSVGAQLIRTNIDFKTSAANTLIDGNTETIKALTVGYNLGAVAIQGVYAQATDLQGVKGADADYGVIKFTTKF